MTDAKNDPKPKTVGDPTSPGNDPFDLSNISVAGTTSLEDLGIERPILNVPVRKPGKQEFFRTHPDQEFSVPARIIELEAERETYLATSTVWPGIPGETKLVKLTAYITRAGMVGLWPLKMPDDLNGRPDMLWYITARKIAEMAQTKWCRMQANMAAGGYDVTTAERIPDPVWPKVTLNELLRIAFANGRLIDRLDHPVIQALNGE